MRPGAVESVHQLSLGEREVRTLNPTPARPTTISLPRSACTQNVVSPVQATSGHTISCRPQARCAESIHPDEHFTPANPEPSQVHSPHGRSPGPVAAPRIEAAASKKVVESHPQRTFSGPQRLFPAVDCLHTNTSRNRVLRCPQRTLFAPNASTW
jgi:hypothetical protein